MKAQWLLVTGWTFCAALAGCSAAHSGGGAARPASATASLSGKCVMGYEWAPNATGADGQFIPGPPPPGNSQGDPALAYQVTLTNRSPAAADVTGFAVAFYAAGSEAGSDQEQASGFITPGQSLAWAVIEDHTVRGYGDDPNGEIMQTGSIPPGADSCQLVRLYGSG